MAEPFCQTEPTTAEGRAFVAAFKTDDVAEVDRLLRRSASLRAEIDTPWFAFDSPAVVTAALEARLAMIDVLRTHGADLAVRTTWWAGGFGVLDHDDRETAEALVAQGAVVDANAAARHGWRDRLDEILATEPEQADRPGGDGQRPLHVAATPEIVDRLLACGATIDARDVDHDATPAQYAAGERPAVCRHLIDRGATPDIYLACALGDAALADRVLADEPAALASRLGDCRHTRESARSGGHIYNWRLRGNRRPLPVAHAFGHHELYEALFVRAQPRDQLLAAAWHGESTRLQDLIVAHPSLVSSLEPVDASLLVQAARDQREGVVAAMLDIGFDPHVQDHDGQTALHAAGFHGFAAIVRLLLERDPAPPLEVTNRYGGTVLGSTAYGATQGWRDDGDHAATVTCLLRAGADASCINVPTGHDGVDTAIRRQRESAAG